MREWIRKLNEGELSQSNLRWSAWMLFFLAFLDASFLPLPISTTFILIILIDDARYFKYVIYTTLGTFLGAMAGYILGYFILVNPAASGDSGIMHFLFTHVPGISQESYARIQGMYTGWGFWILAGASFTPIPYGLISLTAGAFKINLILFIFSVLVSQFLKFFVMGLITAKLGPEIRVIFRKKLKPVVVISVICIIMALIVTGGR